MRTLFNTDRKAPTRGRIPSSEYAIVTVGSRSELGQQVQGQYERQISSIPEIGEVGITFVGGAESGSLSFQRIVSSKGFFDNWDSDECGIINPVSVDLGGGKCVAAANGGLRFEGAMIKGFTFGIQAGQVEINEGINLQVAAMGRA